MSFLGIQVCVFLENDKTGMHQIFQDLGENTLVYCTTYIERHCTRPLRGAESSQNLAIFKDFFLKLCSLDVSPLKFSLKI